MTITENTNNKLLLVTLDYYLVEFQNLTPESAAYFAPSLPLGAFLVGFPLLFVLNRQTLNTRQHLAAFHRQIWPRISEGFSLEGIPFHCWWK